jgi:hydrogenase expression/formation protein HypD
MEVCGTHTVNLFRSGVKSLLTASVRLISGPGCPVCVTSAGYVDAACELAARDGVTICTYGDMVRVPGRRGSLEQARGRGAQVTVVYSARDAVRIAREQPERTVVFLAVGFETTAPATAAAVVEADRTAVANLLIMPAHKLVVPAIEALLAAGDVPIDGFLCPGHVSVIIGAGAYHPIAQGHRKPCVVAGFEPVNMLRGILGLLSQLAEGRAEVENVYGVAVSEQGNQIARKMIDEVFQVAPAVWRAMGTIDASGLALRHRFRRFDALEHFGVAMGGDYEPAGCRCGQVIQGKVEPPACALFGRSCTPLTPVGPCMVSSEGACAAWYKYSPAARPRIEGRDERG